MKRLRPSEESIREIIGGHYNNKNNNTNSNFSNNSTTSTSSTTTASPLIVVGVGGHKSPGPSLYTARQNSGAPSTTNNNNNNKSTTTSSINQKNNTNVALSSEVGGGGLMQSTDIVYPPPSCNNSTPVSGGGGGGYIGLGGSGTVGSCATSGIVVATMPSATNTGSTAVTAGANRSPAMAMQQLSQIRASSALSTSNVVTGSSPPTAVNSVNNTMQQQQQQQQQQQNDNMPPQPQQSPGGTNFQRLKVEDALSYLDLVKFKFGSKPQVYNDFLDIMKEFKSQSIDTPGVIQRVSNLFKGFPDLIKGFNTFLPPGYKIEVQDDGQDYNFQVSGPGIGLSGVVGGGTNMGGGGGSGGAGGGGRSQEGGQTMIMRGSGTINNNMGGGESTTTTMTTMQAVSQPLSLTPIQQQQQQQQHSNLSSSQLQQVTITTSGGGSSDVNTSLQGHAASGSNNSGTGTATAGSGTSGRGAVGSTVSYNTAANNTANQLSSMQQAAQQAQAAVSNLLHQAGAGNQQHQNNNNNNNNNQNNNSINSSSGGAAQQISGGGESGGTATQNQPVQFNHAINYVNKIKNRFQDQPEKYKRFLDILHIYQKEQRTMKESSTSSSGSGHHHPHHQQHQSQTGAGGGTGTNMCMSIGGGGGTLGGKHLTEQEVYSQVAKLFENQSDLLAEFGQFLPDATSHMNNTSGASGGNNPHHHQQLQHNSQSSGVVNTLTGGNHQHNNNNNSNSGNVTSAVSSTGVGAGAGGALLGASAGNALLLAGQSGGGGGPQQNLNASSLGGAEVTVKTNKQIGVGAGKLLHSSSTSGGYNNSSRDGPAGGGNNTSSSYNNSSSSKGDLGYNLDNSTSSSRHHHHHQPHHTSSSSSYHHHQSSNVSTSIGGGGGSDRGGGNHHNKSSGSAAGGGHHHSSSSTTPHSSHSHSHTHHHHNMTSSSSSGAANANSENRMVASGDHNISSNNNNNNNISTSSSSGNRTGNSSGLHAKRSPSYATLLHSRDGLPPSKKHRLGGSAGSSGGGGGALSSSSNLGGSHHSSSSSAAANTNATSGRDPSTVTCRDVTLAEAAKYASLNEYTFFDQVHKAVKSRAVYNNFLRCLLLFNTEIISKSELLILATSFLGKFPELMRWFREFLGNNANNNSNSSIGANGSNSLVTLSSRDGSGGGAAAPYHQYFSHSSYPAYHHNHHHHVASIEAIPYNAARIERPMGELALEIDLTTAKRLGASYCVIPPTQEGMTCSGRTQLCKEVLNDQWVSFPTWSEDSTFVSSRKTQYEEYMYRCEDERFELDVVIETNSATIRYLEAVHKKLSRMSPEEVAKYRLDDCLGGSSPVLQQRAVRRIYGDKAQEIIDGLKRNPAVAVPVVLRRLKAKEEEWRDSQKTFNKIWREHNEKFYLKSLDHQGINFKQTDVKALRSKSLFNEIETLFDERHEQNEEGAEPIVGPHLVLPYKDRTILDDAANLLIHHVKRQTGIQKGEKRRIKHLLRQFIPELFFHPKQQLTDDEREDDDEKEDGDESPNSSPNASKHNKTDNAGSSPSKSPGRLDAGGDSLNDIRTDGGDSSSPRRDDDFKVPLHAQTNDPDEAYTLFMANNNWYIFLRLHAILCERLAKIYQRAVILAEEEAKYRSSRKESTAIALRLKPKPQIEIEDYYMAFLDMVKNLLDGNMEPNTYEDTLREMFGIHAYIAFTLDKVVSYAVRQLQHCVTERTAIACTDLYAKEQKRGATGGSCATAHKRAHLEMAYQRSGEKTVQDENCFKIYVYKNDCKMTIELLDTENGEQDAAAVAGKKVEEAKKWSQYKERYANCRNIDSRLAANSTASGNKQRSPMYLRRNMKKMSERRRQQLQQQQLQQQLQQQQDGDCDRDDSTGNSAKKTMTLPSSTSESKAGDVSDQSSVSTSTGGAKSAAAAATPGAEGNSSTAVAAALRPENLELLDRMERQLNERPLPERNETKHPGYSIIDDGVSVKLDQRSRLSFPTNQDHYFYIKGTFGRAQKIHPALTKRKSSNFRSWLKRWAATHVTDSQQKQCTDWLMGRTENLVPNRTRVFTDNDLTRTPYVPYNRYRVDRLLVSSSNAEFHQQTSTKKQKSTESASGDGNNSTSTAGCGNSDVQNSATAATSIATNVNNIKGDNVTDQQTAPVNNDSNLSNSSSSSSSSSSTTSSSGGGGNL